MPTPPAFDNLRHSREFSRARDARIGWLLETQGQADWRKYARDLYDDPAMRSIGRSFPLLAFLSLAAPTLAGWSRRRRDGRGDRGPIRYHAVSADVPFEVVISVFTL